MYHYFRSGLLYLLEIISALRKTNSDCVTKDMCRGVKSQNGSEWLLPPPYNVPALGVTMATVAIETGWAVRAYLTPGDYHP